MAVSSGRPKRTARWLRRLTLMIIAVGTALSLVINIPPADAASHPAVLAKRMIGHSVLGRPIMAWHLGQTGHGNKKVVLIAEMHGDEQRVSNILTSMRDGRRITGVDLWVVPRYNPDGHAHDTRRNAHGVDLNRNYPASWRRTKGAYNSGKRAASEPETRAMMRFLRRVNPDYVISFHQPLHGVDTLTKSQAFSRKVARNLHLPRKKLSCDGGCHGTMTMWFNRNFHGEALTVEFGASPSKRHLRRTVVTRVLRIFGARR